MCGGEGVCQCVLVLWGGLYDVSIYEPAFLLVYADTSMYGGEEIELIIKTSGHVMTFSKTLIS